MAWIINQYGQQVGAFWAFREDDQHESLLVEHMYPSLRWMTPRPGDALVTNHRRALLETIEDTSPGVHDSLIAACDLPQYEQLWHKRPHDNCTDNLRIAMAAIGVVLTEVPCPLNLWMNTRRAPMAASTGLRQFRDPEITCGCGPWAMQFW